MPADPGLTFLWLSDDPDLNEQSRLRIRATADGIPPDRFETIENAFDQPTLDPGRVYFLNYQKLRAGGLLSTLADRRGHTIWETIAITSQARPGGLVTIIDEAHKGLVKSAREVSDDRTIAAAFVLGGGTRFTVRGADRATPVPFPGADLIVGVSATPTRFDDVLARAPGRTRRAVPVTPAAVRESGLIKQRIVLEGLEKDDPLPWTLLSESVRKVRAMGEAWDRHTAPRGRPPVHPLLLVQVEDAVGGLPSATPLSEVVAHLVRDWPGLTEDAVVHCFGNEAPIQLPNGWTLRREEPPAPKTASLRRC